MIKKILPLLFLIFMIGCGPPPITNGKVLSKKFVPAHTDEMVIPNFDIDGNINGFNTIEDHVPDAWFITFQNDDNEKGEMRNRTIKVPKSTYDNHDVGDWIETQ
jgi:hypothetical protein